MRDQVELRVKELADEFAAGQEMLAKLDAQRAELNQTLLRISGALQVLQELLEPDAAQEKESAPSATPALG